MTKENNHDHDLLRCSFCGKSQNEVERIIAGPNVYICNECIEPVSYTHLDVYKRQYLDMHLNRVSLSEVSPVHLLHSI